jgi:hypothetical protein
MHSKGGGLVTVEQRDQVLLLHGRDQDIRTDACWSRNPAMKRSIASYSNGTWLTRCRTVDNDPRAEQGTYTLKLQDPETLLYKDVSRYDWTLNESKCVATFTTTQTLTRSAGAAAEAVASGTKPTAKPTAATTARPETAPAQSSASECTPGAATRLTLRPKKAEVELGQRACFKVRVSDAADCPLPSSDVLWLLGHANGIRGSLLGGCFTAAESAAEGEGEFRITAKRGGLQAEATVVVRRVDLSALIARRMEGSGLDSADEDEAVSVTPKAVARIEPHVAPPAGQSKSGRGLTWGLGVAALVLLGLGVWVRRRQPLPIPATGSTTPPPRGSHASNGSTRPAGGPPTTPPPIPPAALRVPAPTSKNPDEPWICPTCRIGYPAHQATCPKDGSLLVPYAQFTEQHKRVELAHSKRCPKCGKTYPAGDSFCGDDGSNLVSLQ